MNFGLPLLLVVLLFIGCVYTDGWWLTVPSAPTANGGCGALASDSYYWDTEDGTYFFHNNNQWSGAIPRGVYDDNIRQYFCTGNVDSMPLGSYCFYQNIQNSQSCPTGFTEGTRTQDDEDDHNQSGPKENRNTLPKRDNTYYNDTIETTKWYFCCGSGSPSSSISFDSIRSQLPDTFMLFQKGGSCQVINGRNVQTGWVYWDDEDSNNGNSYNGSKPDGEYSGIFLENTKYFYCTYGPIPYPPTNLQLTQRSSTSVSISWTASAGSGVYYKITTSSTTTKYSSTSITWNSLSPATTYTFYIYAGKNNPSWGNETYETVGTSIQFTTCSSEYTGLNCEQPVCNPTCVHGNCIAPNQCSCDPRWGGVLCNQCTNGYYPNGSGNCLECNCNNHGVCSDGPSGNGECTCNTGYTTPESTNDYCSICSFGYVMQGSICVKCYETCETCIFNSTYCTSCKSGFILENNECRNDCPDSSYYNYISTSCQLCSTSCETCFGGSSNECLSCPNDLLLEAGTCVTNCSASNYPDNDNICQSCQFPCSTCIGPENGECLTCTSPYIQKLTSCLSEIQCLQSGYIDSNRICQDCDEMCSKCYGPNNDQCLTCPHETYLLNGKCLDDCPSGYYSNLTSNKCQACYSRCTECFGINENECSSCNYPFLLNSTTCVSILECSNFGYKDDTFCFPCDESCLKCNGPLPTNCVTCSNSKYLLNGKCLDDCPFGYFVSGSQCQFCSFPCSSCENESTNCLSCVESYSLNSTSCISNEECLLDGYIENGVCSECHSNCSTCNGPTSNNCLSCSESKLLLEGTCVDQCPSLNYYFVNVTKSCERCDVSCSECSGGGKSDCLKCSPNFYHLNEQCLMECPDGYYKDDSSSICAQCSQNQFVHHVFQNIHYMEENCPDGFNSNNGICSEAQNQSGNQVGLGVGLTFGLLFLILIGVLVFFFIKRQKTKNEKRFSEFKMEKRNRFFSEERKRDKFSSRKVMSGSQKSINTPGQSTLLNTEIDFGSFPAFLLLNLGLDFRIEKEIGKGGSGSLSICSLLREETKDMFKTELAVVKILNQKNGKEEQNFFNEVSITWSLSFHPNIVQLIGYCEEPRCILTKLYERDLFSLLHDPNEEIQPSRVIELCLCIIKGIERIHQIGIAHRDLKTKNILIERGKTNEQKDIRAVICDFGLAVNSKNIKEAPSGISPQYASPEVFNSVRLKTPLDLKGYQSGDLFSFGVVVWEIINRQIPWSDSPLEEIEYSIRDGKRLEIGEVDNSLGFLKGMIRQCWKDPQLRPTPSSIIQVFPTP